MPTRTYNDESVLTPGEVAALFRVDAKTVTRWAKAGKLDGFTTPGGHRRFHYAQVRKLIEDGATSGE